MVQTNNNKDKFIRVFELILLIFIAFSGSIFYSLYSLIDPTVKNGIIYNNFQLLSGILSELIAISFLAYLIYKQKRSFRSIGLKLNCKKDIWHSIVITILIGIISPILYSIGSHIYYSLINNTSEVNNYEFDFKQASIILWLLFMIINPFFEELIVRAYLMSEIEFLTNSKIYAILISIAVQTSYHFYQGIASALYLATLFTFWSLYYAKYKKIIPVILSHLYFDLSALLFSIK